MRLGLDLSLSTYRLYPGFDPAVLFAGGRKGGLYDASRLTSLWQDTAGTVPAVVGQTVARWDDLSGNNQHLTQAVAADRPLLVKGTDGRHGLLYDGVSDHMETAAFAWGSSTVSAAAGYLKAVQTTGVVMNFGDSPVFNNGTWEIQSSGSGALGDVWSSRGTVRVPLISNSAAVPVRQRLHGAGFTTLPTSSMLRNGVTVATSSASQGAGGYGTWPLRVGRRADGTQFLNGTVFGLFALNKLMNAAEIAQLDAWLLARTGAP